MLKPIEDQSHQPLAFLSGKLSKSQRNWRSIEKEGFPIIAALHKLQHFLLNPKGFRLFTDHRNLVFIFHPHGVHKATSERLARWADLMMSYKYVVEHLPGHLNVWEDILSRWHDTLSLQALSAFVPRIYSDDFVWPSIQEIQHSAAERGARIC